MTSAWPKNRRRRDAIRQASLKAVPALLFLAMLGLFGALSPAFLTLPNLQNILVQSASTGILAIGMTFVLLTAGVDLSVGSTMFVAAAVGGKLILADWTLELVLPLMCLTGVIVGSLNGFFVTVSRIVPFVVTLATLYLGRGFGLWLTETRAMNLPESFYLLGTTRWLQVPLPIWVFAAVTAISWLILQRTPYGRQIYAVGNHPENAAKAGIPVRRIIASVYALCGLCAAIAGIVALSQAPAVSPTFGQGREFMAIAAAVLGGTSLFGGRGNVFPGTVLGTLVIQTIVNGLNVLNVDPYLYPIVTGSVILLAVLTDSLRATLQIRLKRRWIRPIE